METIKITAWVARDYNGGACMYTTKPERNKVKYAEDEEHEGYWKCSKYGDAIALPDDWDFAFDFLTWADEPVKVEITTVKD